MKIKVSGSDFDKIHRVANVIEKYIELDKLVNSLYQGVNQNANT